MHPASTLCIPPAKKRPGESLAAPAAAGQGVCTSSLMQSGAGMVPMHMGRAPHQWQQITAFLDTLPQRDADATGKRSAGAEAAGVQAIPDGNHGDNRTLSK